MNRWMLLPVAILVTAAAWSIIASHRQASTLGARAASALSRVDPSALRGAIPILRSHEGSSDIESDRTPSITLHAFGETWHVPRDSSITIDGPHLQQAELRINNGPLLPIDARWPHALATADPTAPSQATGLWSILGSTFVLPPNAQSVTLKADGTWHTQIHGKITLELTCTTDESTLRDTLATSDGATAITALENSGITRDLAIQTISTARTSLLHLSDQALAETILSADAALLQRSDDLSTVAETVLALQAWDAQGLAVEFATSAGPVLLVTRRAEGGITGHACTLLAFDPHGTIRWSGRLAVAPESADGWAVRAAAHFCGGQ